MHSGGATRNVATWRMMIGGVNLVTLRFPAVFQFLGLKFSLFLHFPISLIISVSEFSPPFSLFTCASTPILLQSLFCESSFPVCATYFEGTFLFPPLCFFSFVTYLQISDHFFLSRCCLLYGFLGFEPSPHLFLWFFMVSGSEVKATCPSVSFFFARLGATLGVSGDFLPLVGDFIFVGCGLSLVIGELSLILGQFLAWFEGEIRRMAEVRSSELETGLSSSGDPEGGDIAVFAPRVVRAFHALEEVCGLDYETVGRFKDRL